MRASFFLLLLFGTTAHANTIDNFFNRNAYGQALDVCLALSGMYYFCAGFYRLYNVYEGKITATKKQCLFTSLGGLCLYYHVSFLTVICNSLGIHI